MSCAVNLSLYYDELVFLKVLQSFTNYKITITIYEHLKNYKTVTGIQDIIGQDMCVCVCVSQNLPSKGSTLALLTSLLVGSCNYP